MDQSRTAPVPARQRRGALSYEKGRSAEAQVARHYQMCGAQILEERWRGISGEVDLILKAGDDVVFVEVKTSRTHDAALARVTARQMQRICRTAEEYLETCPAGSLTPMRVDVATVDHQGQIAIVENALMSL